MTDCLFCRIASGEVPVDLVYSDDEFIAFRDIDAKAPTHVLVIPRGHRPDIAAVAASDLSLAGRYLATITEVAAQLGLGESGYRIVINTGTHGGQTVFHVHAHLLGARQMTWPPG